MQWHIYIVLEYFLYVILCNEELTFFENDHIRFTIGDYLTLGYMTKTLNQIIFFSSTKIRIFFSATLGIRIYFLE